MEDLIMKKLLNKVLITLKIKFLKLQSKAKNPEKNAKVKPKISNMLAINLEDFDINTININAMCSTADIGYISNHSFDALFAFPDEYLFKVIDQAAPGTVFNEEFFRNRLFYLIYDFNFNMLQACIDNIDKFSLNDLRDMLDLSRKLIVNINICHKDKKINYNIMNNHAVMREADIYFENAGMLFSRKQKKLEGFFDNAYNTYKTACITKTTDNYYTLPTLLEWEIKHNTNELKPIQTRYDDLDHLINFTQDTNSSCHDDIMKQFSQEHKSLDREIKRITGLINSSKQALSELTSQAA